MKQECVMVGKEKIDLDMAMREFDRLSDRIIDLVDDYSVLGGVIATHHIGEMYQVLYLERLLRSGIF